MKRINFWLVIGMLVILVTAIAWSKVERLRGLGRSHQLTEDGNDRSSRDLEPSRVGALGRIEPSSEVLNIGAPQGDRVLRLLVTAGQKVAADEELVYLESHDVALAEKEETAALLQEAKSRSATTRSHSQLSIRTAEIRLQSIEELEPLRIDSQKARIRAMEAEHVNAKNEYNRGEQLVPKNALAREDLDRRRMAFHKQEELLASARIDLKEMESNFTLSRETAKTSLEEVKAALEQSLAAIPVQSLERKLELADVRLKQTIIRAPIAGQILKIHTKAGERIENGPILKLGETSEMHAVAEVYETDVSRVRIGQRAHVSCPALGSPIEGEVVQVGWMIYKNDILNVDPAADADARVVEVRVRLKEPERVAALTQLQVDVLIDVAPRAE